MDSPLTIAAFVTGVTQLCKKLGVAGNWLVLACVVAGGFATFMTNFQPALWTQMTGILVALSATGGVSLLKELAQTMGGPSGG